MGYILYIDGITMEATIHYAATMAKFSYLYQSYDREFATLCLQASDRAYRYAENYLADVSDRQYFFAAAELYRATGGYQYHSVVKSYLTQNTEPDLDDDYVFWGCVTYLSTKQKVDMNLCEAVTENLMRKGETISYASKDSKLLVNTDEKLGGNAGLCGICRDLPWWTTSSRTMSMRWYWKTMPTICWDGICSPYPIWTVWVGAITVMWT